MERIMKPRITTDEEALKIFPQAREIIPLKITELERERDDILIDVRESLDNVRKTDPDNLEFWTQYYALTRPDWIKPIERRIAKLKRLIRVEKIDHKGLTQTDIDRANSTPIDSILGVELKRHGRLFKTNCPMHEDKTPSLFVYQEDNSFYCFSCAKGGDAIALVQAIKGYDFVRAVNYILGI